MSRYTTLTAAAALMAALAAAGAVSAQGRPHAGFGPGGHPGAGFDFEAIDANSDGTITAEELQTRAVARIGLADTDGDGTLSRVELVALVSSPAGPLMNPFGRDRGEVFADRMLARMEATEAGAIVIAEMAERRVSDMLAVFDTDRDGAISQAEADAARARMAGHRHGREGRGRR